MLAFVNDNFALIMLGLAALAILAIVALPEKRATAPQPAPTPPQPQPQPQTVSPAPIAPAQPTQVTSTQTATPQAPTAPTAASSTDANQPYEVKARTQPRLSELSPAELQRIAENYQLKITGRTGNQPDRIIVFVGFTLIVAVVLVHLFSWLSFNWLLEDLTTPALMLSWLVICTFSLWKFFLVNTPKLGAIITRNSFGGRMHVFTPGLAIRFPWEDYDGIMDDLSQRAREVKEKTQFMIKGGIQVEFNWMAQWAPFLPLLPLNIRFEQDDIAAAVTDIVKNTISEEALRISVDEVLKPQTADRIQQQLLLAMEGMVMDDGEAKTKHRHLDAFGNTIEQRVGANMEISTLGPPDFTQDYKDSQTGKKRLEIVKEDAKTMAEELKVSGSEALNAAMLVHKVGGIKEDVFEVQLGENAKEAAKHLGPGLGAAAAALAKTTKGGGNGH